MARRLTSSPQGRPELYAAVVDELARPLEAVVNRPPSSVPPIDGKIFVDPRPARLARLRSGGPVRMRGHQLARLVPAVADSGLDGRTLWTIFPDGTYRPTDDA